MVLRVHTLAVDLWDGRTIIVRLACYATLLDATSEQRANWNIAGAGYGIDWPEIDEDFSVEGLLRVHQPLRTRRIRGGKSRLV